MGKKEKVCVFKVYRLTNYNLYNLYINAGQALAVFILPEERTTGLGCIPDGRAKPQTRAIYGRILHFYVSNI